MSQVLGQLASGNIFTIVFFDDGVIVDRQSPMVKAGYSFGAIGAGLTALARSKHQKKLDAAAANLGPQGVVAVAGAMKRAKAIPYSTVRSVHLGNKKKWSRMITITGQDGATTNYSFIDRKNVKYPQVTSWLSYAPGFTADPPPA